MVFATENPIEQEGTYPLPEAQLDRFMFLIDVGYPGELEEVEIVRRTTGAPPLPVEKVLNAADILAFQGLVRRIPVADHVVEYAVKLVRASRPKGDAASPYIKEHLAWGAGPRASQNLIIGAKAKAALRGAPAASVDDVRAVAHPVLDHRLVVNFAASSAGVTSADVVQHLLGAAK